MHSSLEANGAALAVQKSKQVEGVSVGDLRLLLFQSAGMGSPGVWDFYAWQNSLRV